MESFFGNPWDFSGGFMAPMNTTSQSFQPVAPQVDFASMMAQGLASKGIRPDQFFQNPQIATEVLQPTTPQVANNWDATPVDMPGGQTTRLAAAQPGGTAMSPMDAAAAGTSEQQTAAKTKTPAERLVEGFRGVKAPVAPTPQTIRSPAAPEPAKQQIKTGDLLAMLMAMQPPGAQAGLKLPPTLGASLKGAYG